jgi:hypothetical protein
LTPKVIHSIGLGFSTTLPTSVDILLGTPLRTLSSVGIRHLEANQVPDPESAPRRFKVWFTTKDKLMANNGVDNRLVVDDEWISAGEFEFSKFLGWQEFRISVEKNMVLSSKKKLVEKVRFEFLNNYGATLDGVGVTHTSQSYVTLYRVEVFGEK